MFVILENQTYTISNSLYLPQLLLVPLAFLHISARPADEVQTKEEGNKTFFSAFLWL